METTQNRVHSHERPPRRSRTKTPPSSPGSARRGTRIREEMAKVVVGQETIIDHLLVGLLCRGHILLLGVPGLGKTLMARTLARDARPGVPPHPVHARPDALRHHRHGHHRGRPGDRPPQAGVPPRARSSPTSCWPTRSTARRRRPRPRSCRRCRSARSRSAGGPTRSSRRSSSWPPRTRSRWRAPTRCPRRSSTGSCSTSRSSIRRSTRRLRIVKGTTGTHHGRGASGAQGRGGAPAPGPGARGADRRLGHELRRAAGGRDAAGRVEGDRGRPQIPALRGEPAGLAVPGLGPRPGRSSRASITSISTT